MSVFITTGRYTRHGSTQKGREVCNRNMNVSDNVTVQRAENSTRQMTTLSSSPQNKDTRLPIRESIHSEKKQSAIVIGAGLGGLSAAVYLAQKGVQVTVLEQNTRPGGRMNVICEEGFTIDMGPTMLMMPEVIENLFHSCGRDPQDYLPMQQLLPAYSIQWPDGATLDMGVPVPIMVEQVRQIAPEDAEMLPAMFEAMREKYENARFNFIEKPFNSFSDLLRPSTLRGIARALPMKRL